MSLEMLDDHMNKRMILFYLSTHVSSQISLMFSFTVWQYISRQEDLNFFKLFGECSAIIFAIVSIQIIDYFFRFFFQNFQNFFSFKKFFSFFLYLLFFIGIIANVLRNTVSLEQPLQFSSKFLVLDSFSLENISSNSRFSMDIFFLVIELGLLFAESYL